MSKILLIHWKAKEVSERLARLRRAGLDAERFLPEGPASLRNLRDDPPDAIVIDLSRIPSHGREIGGALRRTAGTRTIPLVFVDGEPAKVNAVRALLPDATYTGWDGIRAAVREAIRRRPEVPVVPGVFEAYSGTPLPKKLGIKEGTTVRLLGAPENFADTLGPLPEGATLRVRAGKPVDLLMVFVKSRAELDRRLAPAIRGMAEKGSLWICWPKQTSGVATNLTQVIVRSTGMAAGLVDFKVAAVDPTWSGLRFARKR